MVCHPWHNYLFDGGIYICAGHEPSVSRFTLEDLSELQFSVLNCSLQQQKAEEMCGQEVSSLWIWGEEGQKGGKKCSECCSWSAQL